MRSLLILFSLLAFPLSAVVEGTIDTAPWVSVIAKHDTRFPGDPASWRVAVLAEDINLARAMPNKPVITVSVLRTVGVHQLGKSDATSVTLLIPPGKNYSGNIGGTVEVVSISADAVYVKINAVFSAGKGTVTGDFTFVPKAD